jgi:hypothetical protein
LRSCCQHPRRVGFAGAGEVLDTAAADGKEHGHVPAAKPDGIDSEEVAGEDRLALPAQERAPAQTVAPRWPAAGPRSASTFEGRLGALLGDEFVAAGPGDLVFKPRHQWHTFWNASDEPSRILEIISRAGFECYFDELVDLTGPRTPATIEPITDRYGLEMKFETIPQLVAEHNLTLPGVN